MRICVAKKISTRDLFANTIYFGDTTEDVHDSSNDVQIRNAFMFGNYGAVSEYLKFPFRIDQEDVFYAHIFENNMCDALLACVGPQLLNIRKMTKHIHLMRNGDSSQRAHRFLIDLARLNKDWTYYRNHVLEIHEGLFDTAVSPLRTYLCERGGGWYFNHWRMAKWKQAWRNWTPEAHADPTNFSLDFRYRARAIPGVAKDTIVRWMAAATWITYEFAYEPFKNKREKMEYLARFRIYVKQSIIAHELDALVLNTRRMITLLRMK